MRIKAETRNAFTLIELLIVVAIIGILAAIAVPNFLEAQVRAKVARVQAELRTAGIALETYMVDHNHYPPHYPEGSTMVTPQSNMCLYRLTTPTAYVTSIEGFRDPFIDGVMVGVGPGLPGAGSFYPLDYYTYQTYETFLGDYSLSAPPNRNFTAWCMYSYGPNHLDDGVAWRMYNFAIFGGPGFYEDEFMKGVYDATNGTISDGDIVRFGGGVPGVAGKLVN